MMPHFWQPVATCVRPWVQLTKVPLCLPVAGSAGFGFILHTPALTPSLGALLCGVFLLACGAAGFNSLQEVSADSLFTRTRNRPLVVGHLTGQQAIVLSFLFTIIGFLALFFSAEDIRPLLLGITALILYNGVYTPLKGLSVFALFPGGLAGGIPPLIGWTAAGGLLSDTQAWLLYSLFFLWQIPHFCLILLCHQTDYRAVERPSLIRLLPEKSLKRIAMVWILACAVVALSLTIHENLLVSGSRLTIGLMAGLLTFFCIPLFLNENASNYRLLFLIFNGSFFCTMLIVTCLQLLSVW